MKRVKLLNNETDSMVDRRVVVKLLTTYFERGQSPEILQLMTRMLGFSGATGSFAMPDVCSGSFVEPCLSDGD